MTKGNFTQAHKEFLRQSRIKRNKSNIGKTYEEIYGIDKAKELRQHKSIESTGRKMSEKNKAILLAISKGKKLTEGTKKKISEARIKSGASKGKKNPLYGIRRFGSDNYNWNGGTSFIQYGPEFSKDLKESIRKRDDYTCQVCLLKDEFSNFSVHHIDYNRKKNHPFNLITLCPTCHGMTNKCRDVWKIWFLGLIFEKYKNLHWEKIATVENLIIERRS